MKLIPAIDLIGGACVRLQQGRYEAMTIYSKDPVATAQEFAEKGIKYLHLVDLEGADKQHIVHHKILQEIVKQTTLLVDFSGGIRTDRDIALAFDYGAHKVTIGSMAISDPGKVYQWIGQYGPERIILGADVRNKLIVTRGWKDTSGMSVFELIRQYARYGIQEVMCTDTGKDGMLQGPATTLYTQILEQCPVSLIASGGVSGIKDLEQLRDIGCSGAIIGKALYEGFITLEALQTFDQSL